MTSDRDSIQPLKVVSPVHKALRQISEHLIRQMDGIGAPGWESHLLSYVEVYGPCRVSELRRVFGYNPSTLTSVLDRLESEGLVARRPNREDRRSILIAVTARGRRIGQAARRVVEGFEADILERLAVADLRGFENVMEAIAEVTKVDLRGKDEE